MFFSVIVLSFLLAACRVCDSSYITEIVDINSDRKLLECRMNTDYTNVTVMWDILYEDGTRDRYGCVKTSRGKAITDCLVYSAVYSKAVACSCSYNVMFSMYMILREPVTSLHRCSINNMTAVFREFFVVPETFIRIGYVGLSARKVLCCVNSSNAVVTATMTQNGITVPLSRSCTDKQCFMWLSRISDGDALIRYECHTVLTMWNITVSQNHSATVVSSEIESVSNTTMKKYVHSGACSGRVTWIYDECNDTGDMCDYRYRWLGYRSGDGEKMLHGHNGVTIRVEAKQCVDGMAALYGKLSTQRVYFKTVSFVFSEYNDIFVYESRFVNLLKIQFYDRHGITYIKCASPDDNLNRFSVTALPGCDGGIIEGRKYVDMETVVRDQYVCIAIEYACVFAAVWVIRDNIVSGPSIIENVTSYVSRYNCVKDDSDSLYDTRLYIYITFICFMFTRLY